jgi:hypothetical protein
MQRRSCHLLAARPIASLGPRDIDAAVRLSVLSSGIPILILPRHQRSGFPSISIFRCAARQRGLGEHFPGRISLSGSAHEGVDDKNIRRSIAPTRPHSWQATPGLRTPDEDRPVLKARPSLLLPIQAPARWIGRLSSGERRQMPAKHRTACSPRKPTSRSRIAWSRPSYERPFIDPYWKRKRVVPDIGRHRSPPPEQFVADSPLEGDGFELSVPGRAIDCSPHASARGLGL